MGIITRREFLKILGTLPYLYLGQAALNDLPSENRLLGSKNLPNILILVFDAFSAKNSSLYGYPRPTTPNIERFANRSIVFHRHYAGGNFTSPGTATLLTGSYPWKHQVFNFLGSVTNNTLRSNVFELLQEQYFTFAYTHNPLVFVFLHKFQQAIQQLKSISELCLTDPSVADRLLEEDYPIALEAENLLFRNLSFPSASLFLSNFDAARRFYLHNSINKRYRERFPRGVPRFSFESPPGFMYFLLEDAVNWLQKQLKKVSQPFFGYVHFFPPHSPYVTRMEFVNKFDDNLKIPIKPEHYSSEKHPQEFLNYQRKLYDESILYADAEFGRLYDFMENAGILENTYLFLTSDHGEMFERGILGHNTKTLYEPIIRVPLVVSSPGQLQRRDVHTLTGNVDILPTLAKIAHLTTSSEVEGFPLPIFEDDQIELDRSLYVVEAKENPKNSRLEKASVALIKENRKLIHTFGYANQPDHFELYDISDDPEELNNIFQNSEVSSLRLRDELLSKIAKINQR